MRKQKKKVQYASFNEFRKNLSIRSLLGTDISHAVDVTQLERLLYELRCSPGAKITFRRPANEDLLKQAQSHLAHVIGILKRVRGPSRTQHLMWLNTVQQNLAGELRIHKLWLRKIPAITMIDWVVLYLSKEFKRANIQQETEVNAIVAQVLTDAQIPGGARERDSDSAWSSAAVKQRRHRLEHNTRARFRWPELFGNAEYLQNPCDSLLRTFGNKNRPNNS